MIAFKRFPGIWMVDLLATDIAYRDRKQGYRLKREVLELAALDGDAQAVASYVHRDNLRMRKINRDLGGVETDVDASRPHLLVTIPV